MNIDLESILEETKCKNCGHQGVESNGSYDYICPHCGTESSLIDEEE